jgi:hypothetical protein
MAAYIADRRLYLNKDGKVVEDGDPSKVSLLVGAGGSLSEARARELGLIKEEPVEEKAKAEPARNKVRASAPANKSKA